MKKSLALVLAFALVFSTFTVAFAEDATIGADAKVCADLGMLVGDGSGVTPAYLATTPNRLQAAIMVLRLKGLEADAKAFAGTENFADADKAAWAKPIMGYLKAHPELGWQGDGTNFDPTAPMTAQAYYKVMLEVLGYKQNSATVVGDFTWENVITFAASKGLTKAAAVTSFTLNDLAAATTEALKATVKDTTKTLVASLVEAGKVDKAKAVAAGVYTEVSATTAALDTVFATANDKVEVGFDAEVDKAFAENAANFKIVAKGSTTALEVTSAVLASDPTFVVLTTAAQVGGSAYTLTVGADSANFAGAAKNTAAPEIDTVKCVDTNTVEVVFKKAVDRASAEDVANYTLDKSATVKKAELWASQDDSRKTVKLTTEGIANSKVYTLKVANVKSADLAAMKSASKSFTGITDTKAPSIEGAVVVSNNQRILVNFKDTNNNGIDKASAENLANWSIKDSSGNELKIVSLKAVDNVTDDYSKYDQVEVATETQNSGTKYTVTINNLSDDSVSKNVITKALTKTFTGKAADKSAPTVASATAKSDTAIMVEFNDQNRLDPESLTNISNYTFEKDITVTAAKILASTKPDRDLGKTVLLTTTAMDEDTKSYKLTITGVADEFGNVMKTYNKSISYKAEDVSAPVVVDTTWVDLNTVKVEFDETLDSASASDPANYTVNNDLGTVTKAETSSSNTNKYKIVTLTVPTMAENKNYTITISGVKDLLGNATADVKAKFTSQRDGMDSVRPEIVSTEAVSKSELKVTFDEAVSYAAGTTLTAKYTKTNSFDTAVTFNAVGSTLDDETTVVFESTNTGTTGTGVDDRDFRITEISTVSDKSGNKFVVDTDDYATFSGTTTANEKAEVDSIEQIDVRTIKVVFDKPIKLTADRAADDNNIDLTVFDGVVDSKAYVDIDEEGSNDAYSTLTIKTDSAMPYDATYDFTFATTVEDYMGDGVTDLANEKAGKTTLTTTIDDEDGPVIEYVEAVHEKKVQVHYNEEIFEAGTYKIYKDGESTPVSGLTITASVDSDDATIVNLSLNNSLVKNDVYQIKPASAAKDYAGNKADTKDVEFSFVGSTVMAPRNYIKGVAITNLTTIKVYATTDLGTPGAPAVVSVLNGEGQEIAKPLTATEYIGNSDNDDNDDFSVVKVLLKESLVDEEEYDVTIGGMSYTFTASVDDGGIAIDANIITFSGTDVTSYVVQVVYEGTTYIVKPSTNDPTTAKFDVTTMYVEQTPATPYTFATMAAGAPYVVKVYKTLGDLTIDGVTNASATTYKAEYLRVGIDSAPIYSQRLTTPTP